MTTGCVYTQLPQGGVALDLDHVQGVEVGHKQVGLSVGWKRRGEEEVTQGVRVCVCACVCVCVCVWGGALSHMHCKPDILWIIPGGAVCV